MKILLINHYAGSPTHGMEYRPYYFAREWVRLGHSVTIAAATRSHLRQVNPRCHGIYKTEVIDGIRYIWFWAPSYSGNGIARALNIAVFMLQLLVHRSYLAKACRDGVAIASSTYPLDVVPARSIARQANAKLTYEVHDLWPLSPSELGGMSSKHPFIRVMQWAEDFAYRKVSNVVSVLPLAEPHMREHGLAPGKFWYIPNGISFSDWVGNQSELPELHRSTLSVLRAEKRFLIGYAGTHGWANALDILIQAAALLVQSQAVFVLVGLGPQKQSLQALAAKLRLANVVFLPPVPKAAIPSLLAEMDCLTISWQLIPIYRFGVCPNKLIDYMMAGRPIIHAIEAGNDMVAESGCGISIPPEDPSSFASAVLRMMDMSPFQRDEMGRCGRKYVEEHHDFRELAAEFLDAIGASTAVEGGRAVGMQDAHDVEKTANDVLCVKENSEI